MTHLYLSFKLRLTNFIPSSVGILLLAVILNVTLAPASGKGSAIPPVYLPMVVQSPNTPRLGGCDLFPVDNIWNTPIDQLPVDPNSAAYINAIGAGVSLHADFGAGLWNNGPIGIPYNLVPGSQPMVPITFQYADESDSGPYPIPPNPLIEGGPASNGDRHVLVLDTGNCWLYETWDTHPNPDGSWTAGSGAIFDLRSNLLRPDTYTSADAAGLPILPGLVKYDEVLAGAIRHAIRFTSPTTADRYVWPARHKAPANVQAGSPPMGQYFRLKASFDLSTFSPQARVILQAMKTYGLILADNGSSWYISGAPDERWDNDALHADFLRVKGSDFEAVDVSSLIVDPNSGQVR